MDANRTRFMLAMGRDWKSARDAGGLPPLEENGPPNNAAMFKVEQEELLLRPTTMLVRKSSETTLTLDRRFGAVRDRSGNTYVVEGNGIRLRCCAPMGVEGSDGDWYWQSGIPLRSLAITEDDILLAGGGPKDGSPGCLLIFDLRVEQPPFFVLLSFVPFDLCAAGSDGWILDRDNRKVWRLHLEVPEALLPVPPAPTGFEVCDPVPPKKIRGTLDFSFSLPADVDSVGIESLPDEGVAILFRASVGGIIGFHNGSEVFRYLFSDLHVDGNVWPVGHDLIRQDNWLVVVDAGGRQAFGFDISPGGLVDRGEFLPMIDYRGLDLVVGDGDIWYQGGKRWLPLVNFPRPRYPQEPVTVDLPFFDDQPGWDSGIPGCIWHRVLLDLGMPKGVLIQVFSRAADTTADLEKSSWNQEPPLYLRPDGVELPFISTPHPQPTHCYETLFQHAVGRFLQLRLSISSDGRSTARIAAIRAYYPRFSYLENYLPAAWREDPVSASFVDRYLSNPEGLFTNLEDRVAAFHLLLDPNRLDADYLPWLASWFEVLLHDDWNEAQRRFFLRYATWFFGWRGTPRGIRAAIRLVLDTCPSTAIFEDSPGGVQVVDDYRKRVRVGRLSEERKKDAELDPSVHWEPDFGAQSLHDRWHTWLQAEAAAETAAKTADLAEAAAFTALSLLPYPMTPSSDVQDLWNRFHLWCFQRVGGQTLTDAQFSPLWIEFLELEASQKTASAAVHQTSATQLTAAVASPFPVSAPALQAAAWEDFCKEQLLFVPSATGADKNRFQLFRARRYGSTSNWTLGSTATEPLFKSLPADKVVGQAENPLQDWYDFESLLLPMAKSAHRFTITLPTPAAAQIAADPGLTERLRAQVSRIVELEKPAHTIFSVAYADYSFTPGNVHLGIDTLLGGAEPDVPPFELNRDSLAAASIAALFPAKLPASADGFDEPLPLEPL